MAEIEVWRGSVAAWECDAMGHLNVGFYVAKSMEALAVMAAELGLPRAFAPTAQATLIVREQYVRFLREARMNTPLTMTGGVLEIGEQEARLLFVMRHPTGDMAATFQTVVAHATAREGRAFPWSDRVRARAEALRTQVPEGGAPRSVVLAPVEPRASLDRAEALGMARAGLGAVLAQDCDAFGRLRTEGVMQRLSPAMPHLFLGQRPAPGAGGRGGAALEYRLIHRAWPRAGDRVVLRSGFQGGDGRFQRIFHWVLDPETGKPWATAEAISVAFDLTTRKMITMSDEELAAAKARWTPELSH
ncbi:acyl-ACP thioesterase [Phenylobacterium sp.]|uniref:acyl-ACP thioesterase n=1 Tax=Phenylobacterium sp. TaxID=1871053 RepID=UPI0025E02D82|nr:acyl-ACP thioesterase [Phenylobacterium sp.]